MQEDLDRYNKLTHVLHILDDKDLICDTVRDNMDFLWNNLSPEEIVLAKKFSSDLYTTTNPPCPCIIADNPCHPNCTCIKSFSSRGCDCCAKYGSEEQRKSAANRIVNLVKSEIPKRGTEFRFRVWVHPIDGDSADIEIWYDGLEPTENGKSSYSEWILESFRYSDFHEMFELDKTKHWQVVGTASIYGYRSLDEYDEDITIISLEKAEVPESWFNIEIE